jgi:hypothetical protein
MTNNDSKALVLDGDEDLVVRVLYKSFLLFLLHVSLMVFLPSSLLFASSRVASCLVLYDSYQNLIFSLSRSPTGPTTSSAGIRTTMIWLNVESYCQVWFTPYCLLFPISSPIPLDPITLLPSSSSWLNTLTTRLTTISVSSLLL